MPGESRSGRLLEVDLDHRTSGDELIHCFLTPVPLGLRRRHHSLALLRVGDRCGAGWEVDLRRFLQVEPEFRVGDQVGVPISNPRRACNEDSVNLEWPTLQIAPGANRTSAPASPRVQGRGPCSNCSNVHVRPLPAAGIRVG